MATRRQTTWSDRVSRIKMMHVGSDGEMMTRVLRAVRTAGGALAVAALVASTVALALGASPTAAIAQEFTVDSAATDTLTNYLRQNRLPLVGAQIGTAPGGERRLVLYGYVATEHGKSDAESKAVAQMGAPAPEVVNRIVVQPEIAKMKSGGGQADGGQANDSAASSGSQDNSPTGDASAYAGASAGGGAASGAFPNESIDQVLGDIQRFGVKSPPDDAATE
jgi:hypothetical protein